MQLHHVHRRDFATIVHTLRHVFPHVALFYGGGQGILVASQRRSRFGGAPRRARARPRCARDHARRRPLPELLDDVLLVSAGLDRFLAESARLASVLARALISTDHNLYLEYATPRGNVLPWSERDVLVGNIHRHRDAAAIQALIAD